MFVCKSHQEIYILIIEGPESTPCDLLSRYDPEIMPGGMLVLNSYQAVYCLRTEDPENIPGGIVAKNGAS